MDKPIRARIEFSVWLVVLAASIVAADRSIRYELADCDFVCKKFWEVDVFFGTAISVALFGIAAAIVLIRRADQRLKLRRMRFLVGGYWLFHVLLYRPLLLSMSGMDSWWP